MRSPPRAALQDGFVLCQSRTKQFRLAPADCIEGNIQCPATQHALNSIIHAMPNQNNLHSRPPNLPVEAEPHATDRKSAVSGKSFTVRVELGGLRINKKK